MAGRSVGVTPVGSGRCRADSAGDLAEADPGAVRPGCGRGDAHDVAVLQERPPPPRTARPPPWALVSGAAPFHESSSSEPYWSLAGPLTVPEANRSPVRSDAPFTVRCVNCWAGVQYISRNGGRLISSPLSRTSSARSRPHGWPLSSR